MTFLVVLATSLLLASLVLTAVPTRRQIHEPIVSLCVEQCSSDSDEMLRTRGLEPCRLGYECKFNGCGHTCQRTVPEGCPDCRELGCFRDQCDIAGDGCPICKGVGR